jgi:hypothetical protein
MSYFKKFATCALVFAVLMFPVADVMGADDAMIIRYKDGSTQKARIYLNKSSKAIMQIEFQEGKRVFVRDDRKGDRNDQWGDRNDQWDNRNDQGDDRDHRRDNYIKVISATYGNNCGAPRGNVTNYLAEACDGKETCVYIINYRLIGDPASGCAKDFIAEWQCGRDQKRQTARALPEAGEGKGIALKCSAR